MLVSVELQSRYPGLHVKLLLIFYLLVEKEHVPIILDQPEERIVLPVIRLSLRYNNILDCTANF